MKKNKRIYVNVDETTYHYLQKEKGVYSTSAYVYDMILSCLHDRYEKDGITLL